MAIYINKERNTHHDSDIQSFARQRIDWNVEFRQAYEQWARQTGIDERIIDSDLEALSGVIEMYEDLEARGEK